MRHGVAICGLLALVGSLAGGTGHAETPLERGTYLVHGPAACSNCHTLQGPTRGPELAGGMEMALHGWSVARVPNITPDKATGIGGWTDSQIINAIREGHRPDGSMLGPPMAFRMYRNMSDVDVTAIVAYMRSVAPVEHAVPASTYAFPLPHAYGPPVVSVAAVSAENPLAYGHYLSTAIGHCMECHSAPDAHGAPDIVGGLGAGGMHFAGPWGESIAANLTPRGLGQYSDTELKTIITTGVRPDGSHLLPPMGVAYYAHMSGADVSDIVAYLRTLPVR